MLDDQTTLADFFTLPEIATDRLEELNAHATVAELRARLAKEFDGFRWSAVWDAVTGQLEKLLEVRFVDILLGAWTKYDEIIKYGDPASHPPEEAHLVPLIEHTVVSTHDPAVEIQVGETFCEKVPFKIELTLKLSGMMLQIRAGRILKIYTGRCQGSGSVKCSGITLLEKEAMDIHLPDMMDLGEGVAIGRP